jgi:hypothetical protein
MQTILANKLFFQHAKLNMAGFVLYLLVSFALRCMMVELRQKQEKLNSPRGMLKGIVTPWIAKKHSAVSTQQAAKNKTNSNT